MVQNAPLPRLYTSTAAFEVNSFSRAASLQLYSEFIKSLSHKQIRQFGLSKKRLIIRKIFDMEEIRDTKGKQKYFNVINLLRKKLTFFL